MDFNPTPYDLVGGIQHWLLAFSSFVLIVLFVSLLGSLAAYGANGPIAVFGRLRDGAIDMTRLSWRRIWALTMLTFKESVRRKALLVFIVFAILFMFAGWFISDANARTDLQVAVYVAFVLRTITWLCVPVVMLLSCWGIPDDIKKRSLHTVVTKPARRSEIVIGRVLGFAAVGTMVLLIMSAVGYFWLVRQIPADAELLCRVPVYTNDDDFGFTDVLGREVDEKGERLKKGVNVGNIFEFRSYIKGATQATAIWEFKNVGPHYLVDKVDPRTGEIEIDEETGEPVQALRLESRFEAFRSHKGSMKASLLCELALVNKSKNQRVPTPAFELNEFRYNVTYFDRKLSYYDQEKSEMVAVDLIDDLVDKDGTLRVEAKCLDVGQLIGMARSDLFLRLPDRNFFVGFVKSVFGIWLLVILITVLGVTASCFLKGPVATFLTFAFIVMGQWFQEFMTKMVEGQIKGGGPAEAWYRLLAHMNPQTRLPETATTKIITAIDHVLIEFLWLVKHVIPDFTHFNMTPYVANNFDIPWSAALLPSLVITAAYIIPCILVGYYSLSIRELETK